MIVVDASVVVSALVDSSPIGMWSEGVLRQDVLVAPALLPAEVANVLRRTELGGQLVPEIAAQAFADVMTLPIQLYPFDLVSTRVWELRESVTAHDAWCVALAEALKAPLATLDDRLVRAPGPRCRFLTP